MKFVLNDTQSQNLIHSITEYTYHSNTYTLIDIITRSKADAFILDFFSLVQCLPSSIKADEIKRKIQATNRIIHSIAKRTKLERDDIESNEFELIDDENSSDLNLTKVKSRMKCCASFLSIEENDEYLNFQISEKDIYKLKQRCRRGWYRPNQIALPKLDSLTDFFALNEFYFNLTEDYKVILAGDTIVPLAQKYVFNTTLTKSQIETMYQKLLDGGFIDSLTDKEEFLWSFGIAIKGFDSSNIVWKKSQSLAVYFIDTLFTFGFLINYEKVWAIGGRIFGMKNMAQTKQNYISNNSSGKPKGYESIDEIINSL